MRVDSPMKNESKIRLKKPPCERRLFLFYLKSRSGKRRSKNLTDLIKSVLFTVITKSIVLKFFRQLKHRARFVLEFTAVLKSLHIGHKKRKIFSEYSIYIFQTVGHNFIIEKISEGVWRDIKKGHFLFYLGKSRLLDWVPKRKKIRVFELNSDIWGSLKIDTPENFLSRRSAPGMNRLTGKKGTIECSLGTRNWREIAKEAWEKREYIQKKNIKKPLSKIILDRIFPDFREGNWIINIANEIILNCRMKDGSYSLYTIDNLGHFLKPICSGKLDFIDNQYCMDYLGRNNVLFWVPKTGDYRLYRFSLKHKAVNHFSLLYRGNLRDQYIFDDHSLVFLQDRYVLDWKPSNGQFYIWNIHEEFFKHKEMSKIQENPFGEKKISISTCGRDATKGKGFKGMNDLEKFFLRSIFDL